MGKKRIVGIDYGLARIGVAISDPSHIIASPIHTIKASKNTQQSVKELLTFLKDYEVECIVVGMPLRLNGQASFSTDETKHFVEILKQHCDFEIISFDERLTTVQMERVMKEASMSRKKRSKVIDAACATLILQSYLDQKPPKQL